MTEEEITLKIKQIKQLIVERRFKKAFLNLAEIIEEIDRLDKDDVDDVELENKMLLIKSRFNSFNNKAVEGVSTDNAEFNQITMSILNFLDEVKHIAIEYKSNALSIPNAPQNPPPETIAQVVTNPPLDERSGCLVAFNNKDTNVRVQVKNFSLSKIILSLGALLVALGIFFSLTNLGNGCGQKTMPEEIIVPPDTTDVIEKPSVLVGPGGKSLNLSSDISAYQLAEKLSHPDTQYPFELRLKDLNFGKNTTKLSRTSKAELESIVTVLKAYPKARFDILGYQKEDESAPPSANPKVSSFTLDELRARQIFNFLRSRGIPASQMNYVGDGVAEGKSAALKVWSRN